MNAKKLIEDDADDRLDNAVSDISSYDLIKTEDLARYLATIYAESSQDINDLDDWYDIWFYGRTGFKNMSREDLIEQINDEMESSASSVIKWVNENPA